MFRRFRTGSPNVMEHGRSTAQSSPREQSENHGTTASELPALPFRSNSDAGSIGSSYFRGRQQSNATDDTLVETVASASGRRASRDKDTEGDPLGLSLIYGTSDSDADLIFVHGLGGSSRKTWSWERNPDNFWPAWIRHEQGLSHFRVFSFGYNANFNDSNNPLSILDFSKGLLVRMRTYSQGDESSSIGIKPIIFIAHSMGGLVVKKALIIGKNDGYYSLMLSKVHGIMFLSTPHRGSSYAHSLNNLLSVMVGTSSKVYISELESSSTSIEDIGEQFRAICGSWGLVSLYESLPTKLSPGVKRMIVGKDSGVLNYPREISSPVDADHHTVCKYQSRLDPNYLLVTDLLRQMTHNIRSEVLSAPQESSSDNSKELLEGILGIQGSIREDLDKNLFRALPGSCQWLHRRDSFRYWLDASDIKHRILCLTGLPGTGKSTLAAKTVDYIQKALTERSCQYHFFIESQPTKRTAAHCLRTIAFQLAMNYPIFADKIVQLHHDSGFTASSQKFQVIWDTIFENIIFKFDFGCTLHWVIDAVDEADTPRLLVTHLTQMENRNSIKVLFLTRPKKEITSLITSRFSASYVESVSIENTISDIRHYVRSLVREILPNDELTQERVIEQITTKAQGSFLWTKLALESLRNNWHTAEDIRSALNRVPKDMQSLYQRMIDNVKEQPPRLQSIAFRVLAWASCGFRPLSIAELDAALKPDYDGFVSLSETVVQICGHFIRVDDETISLIHSTARQFLLNSSSVIEEYLGTDTCHDHLAVACLQYLCQDHWRQTLLGIDEDSSNSDRLQSLYGQYPLLQYSLNHWAYHVSNATLGAPTVLMFLRLLCSKFMLQWIHAVSLSNTLQIIPRAARHLKSWVRRCRKHLASSLSASPGSSELLFLEEWVIDLIRITGKFGPNLLHKPSTIYRHIPPLCPESSIISRMYNQSDSSLLSVKGLSTEGWDDRLSRLPLGLDALASKIRCAGVYFLTLIPHSGTVILWHKETCSEVRRLEHQEWVTLVETNKTGSLAATGGRFTFRVWDLSTGQQLYSFAKDSPARAMSLEFFNFDAELAVAYDDCTVVSIDLTSSKERIIFAENNPHPYRSCPRFMALSPDQTKVAIGFRGRPVVVWDMSSSSRPTPRMCIRMADKDLLEGGDEVFNSPEIIRWHSNNSLLFILYQDTTVVMWDMIEDEQFEFGDTEAREMVLNNDGTLLLTSSNSGSISVWAIPKFNLVYRLHSDEFVRDLTFSPDGHHIYDVRGSGCNVWAPDILVRPDDTDREETSSSFDGSSISEALSEPVFAQDHSFQSRITALITDNEDEYFCCGRDDGSVSLHSITDGKRVRKVSNHSATADIVCIEWSLSRRYLASADDSGKIIMKRLRIKEDGKWAVFPVIELRVDESILQMLFNPEETLILISTYSMDLIWDIKSKKQVYKKIWKSTPGRKWLNHPENPAWLIQLWPHHQAILQWTNPDHAENAKLSSHPREGQPDVSDSIPSIVLSSPDNDQETVSSVIYPSSYHYLVIESLPRKYSSKSRSIRGAKWDLVSFKNLTPANCASAKRKTLLHLESEIQQLIGCYHDRLVFLDHKNWLCTCIIGWETGPIKRHFFLPRDWINASTLNLLAFNKKGTLLCAREGDVAIVRYARGY